MYMNICMYMHIFNNGPWKGSMKEKFKKEKVARGDETQRKGDEIRRKAEKAVPGDQRTNWIRTRGNFRDSENRRRVCMGGKA